MALISVVDVKRLADDPSPQSRAATAAKLARAFDDQTYSPTEVGIACDIFRLLVRDTAVAVRRSLVDVLRANPWVPHDIALALARDIDAVALPMLEFSPVLTEDDLIDIIEHQRSQPKMRAIAARPLVPEAVVESLTEHGDRSVAAILASNSMSFFTESSFARVLDRFGQCPDVNEPLACRADIPPRVLERVLTYVVAELRERLIVSHGLDRDRVLKLTSAAGDRAILDMSRSFSTEGRAALVSQLRDSGKLTVSLLLRAVCLGYIGFFEAAVAAMAGYELKATKVMLRERRGLETVCQRAGIAARTIPVVASALTAARSLEHEGRDMAADQFSRRVVERVMTDFESIADVMDQTDVEYLVQVVEDSPHP